MKLLLLTSVLLSTVYGKCLLGFQYTSYSNRTLYTTCKDVGSKNLENLKGIQPFSLVKLLELVNFSGSFNNNSLSAFPDLNEVQIKESDFSNLTKDVLEGCCQNVTKILFRDNNVNLVEDLFQNSKELKSITIFNENVIKIDEIFTGLTKLEILIVNNSKVEEISEEAFSDLSNLQFLELNENNITEIKPKTLKPLTNLKTLTLFNNNHLNLTLSTLSNLKNLQTLGLNSEIVTTFKIEDIQENLPNLKTILFKSQDESCHKEFLDSFKNKTVDVKFVTFTGEPICVNKS